MTTNSTRPSTGTPVASSERTPFSRRVLKLEHPANVGPLAHIMCWIGLLAFGLLVPAATNWYLAVPLIATLTLLNFSITIGVLHMHTHRPLFVSRRVNRVIDVLCCLPAALTAAEMREVHILSHHRYNDGPGDVTSTEGREQGLRAVWYWIRYGTIVKNHAVRTIFAANPSPGRRKRRYQFILDFTLVVTLIAATLYVTDDTRFALFYWIPFVVTQVNTGYFAWLTHAPARVFEDDPSRSMNTVGNWLNFFIFNQGYHSVHHRYPGIHWSQIPDKLDVHGGGRTRRHRALLDDAQLGLAPGRAEGLPRRAATASDARPSWRRRSRRAPSARGTCRGSHGSDHGAAGADRSGGPPSPRPVPLALAGYAFAAVTAPLLLLFAGGWWLPKTVDAGPHLSTVPSVVIDVLLLALFGLQHSGMARPSFKALVTRRVPEPSERTVYVVDGLPGRVGATPGLAAPAA